MKTKLSLLMAILLCFGCSYGQKPAKPAFVDYDAFEELVKEVKAHRAKHLLSLDSFLQKSKEPFTIILDTRSKKMYDLKHIAGAIHLNFSDFTQQALDSLTAPYAGRNTQILIYCNNNFTDSTQADLQDMAFVTKTAFPLSTSGNDKKKQVKRTPEKRLTLALNIPTYINLYGYGYKNVYELSELVDVNDIRILFDFNHLPQWQTIEGL